MVFLYFFEGMTDMVKSNKDRRKIIVTAVVICAVLATVFGIAELIKVVWPQASGDIEHTKDGFLIDASHTDEGYVMVKHMGDSAGLKLRVSSGGMTYTYDVNDRGDYEVIPLQMGNGTYTYSLYRNVKSNKYTKEAEVSFAVELADPDIPFRGPSQYVNYTPETAAVLKSYEICEGLETDEEKVRAVIDYMVANFTYDFERAKNQTSFYLGDVDGCFETRMGLCQDFAVVFASMLRVQGIPTQMVIGYCGNYYHAWNKVKIDDEYILIDITAEINGTGTDHIYTEERIY